MGMKQWKIKMADSKKTEFFNSCKSCLQKFLKQCNLKSTVTPFSWEKTSEFVMKLFSTIWPLKKKMWLPHQSRPYWHRIPGLHNLHGDWKSTVLQFQIVKTFIITKKNLLQSNLVIVSSLVRVKLLTINYCLFTIYLHVDWKFKYWELNRRLL